MTDLLSSFELYRHAVPKRTIKQLPIKTLLSRRKERWVRDIRMGTVILRRIGYLDAQATGLDLAEKDERYHALAMKAQEYESLKDLGIDISPQQEQEYEQIGAELAPYEKYFQMLCFVTYDDDGNEVPQFETLEEYDAFLSFLTVDELTVILGALSQLMAPISGELPEGDLILADELGMPISEGLALDKLSFEEAKAYSRAVQKKYDTVAKGMG